MAWKIHSWSPELGTGSIASPHFGPVPFEASANVDGVVDYRVGEPIEVELQGRAPAFRVLRIRPFVQRQPPRTHYPAFDVVNGRFGDARFEERSEHRLVFWLGDCCEYCTPNPTWLRFDGVSSVVGLDDDLMFHDPLFRLASQAEVDAHGLVVPDAATAFCIVTAHGHGLDGPSIFIVALAVEVAHT